jgi:hypothetical protein
MEDNMDAIFDFVKMFTGLKYEALPGSAVAAAKKEVLDSLATALGGSSKAGIGELVATVKNGEEENKALSLPIELDARHQTQPRLMRR